ncbi:MAG: class I SAM-dependent methyltransferase [Thaumarchaeota archaeon]|nr:class I SAM-dependent methyltransferase [Nitrososphaerota archaeon]
MGKNQSRFSDWNDVYKQDVTTMPWYSKNLDPDLEDQIKKRSLSTGKFLDLGTGPGTQAIHLAKLGFDVTGTDLSKNAIKKAQKLGGNVKFLVDDILHSKLQDNSFDYILDRGCFHVLPIETHAQYAEKIHDLLTDDGLFFLKCFSINEKKLDYGPHRFSQKDLKQIFKPFFTVKGIKDTVYHGTLDPMPQAIFVVMKKRSIKHSL